MRRRVLEVEFDGVGSLMRGHGSRELIAEVVGRPPVWRTLAHGWSVQEHTARDVVALAEERGYDIVVLGPQATRQRREQMSAPAEVTSGGATSYDIPPASESEGLW